MDELSLKKQALERKLKQGEENIAALSSKLERSDEVANAMCGILDSFNERLHKLEDTIRPIHDETTKLKTLQGNVDKTLSAIDKVIAFHSLPEEVEQKIQEGERGEICGTVGRVDEFLKVMERLQAAIDFFKRNRIQSVESTATVTLYERGLKALAKDFRNQLSRSSSVTLPLPILMDMVQQPAHEEPPPVEHLQERLVEDLAAIADYLSTQKVKLEEDFLSVYSQYRSNQLRKSLTQLKEAAQFTAMAPTNQRRGTITNLLKMESPAKMKANKPKSAPKSASSASMLKGEGQDEDLEGCALFLATTKVFMRLMQSEQSLMMAILPREHQQEVFDRLTQTTFEQYIRRGDDLLQRAKRELTRQNTTAIIAVCKVVREMRGLEQHYAFLLAELPSRNFNRYSVLVDKFEALNLGALEEFVTSVKSDPEKHSQSMPKDGTVHEFTSNTMGFVEQLLEYQDVMGRCLASSNRSGVTKLPAVTTERDMAGLIGQYLCQVTNALAHNLEGKSKTYDSPTLQALFLLNNYHFMHSVFQRNARMMSLLEEDDPRVEKKYIALIEAQLTNYRKCFNHVAGHITPTAGLLAVAQGKGDKLQKSQRQMIKDRFKAFNVEMDELTRIQRSYAIPDGVLRSRVKQGNVDFLLQKYNEFYANFSKVGFTQHPEKYLKYTPPSLEETLNKFFDVNA